MDVAELLTDLFGRMPPLARDAIEDLSDELLVRSPGPDANTVGWLVWHAARVQDHQFSAMRETEQIWTEFAGRFGLAPDPDNTGYGHTTDEMSAVRPESSEVLVDYVDRCIDRALSILAGVRADELDRIIDRNWDPPVTLGVRLVSVADDGLQHLGQAAYVRGLLLR